jgi:hypothetical protein
VAQLEGVELVGTGTGEELGAGDVGLVLGGRRLVEPFGGAPEVVGSDGVAGRVGGDVGVGVAVGVRDGVGGATVSGTEIVGGGIGVRFPGGLTPESEAGRTRK